MYKRNRFGPRPQEHSQGYTTVYSSRLRSDTIDNNRLYSVNNETQSRLDLSCDAVAVELVYKETVAHFVKCPLI